MKAKYLLRFYSRDLVFELIEEEFHSYIKAFKALETYTKKYTPYYYDILKFTREIKLEKAS